MANSMRDVRAMVIASFSVPPVIMGRPERMPEAKPTTDYEVAVRLLHDLWLRGGFGQPINSLSVRHRARVALDNLGEPWRGWDVPRS